MPTGGAYDTTVDNPGGACNYWRGQPGGQRSTSRSLWLPRCSRPEFDGIAADQIKDEMLRKSLSDARGNDQLQVAAPIVLQLLQRVAVLQRYRHVVLDLVRPLRDTPGGHLQRCLADQLRRWRSSRGNIRPLVAGVL